MMRLSGLNRSKGAHRVEWPVVAHGLGPLAAAESLARGVRKGRLEELTEAIGRAAEVVHRELGPGLVKEAYEACLAYELTDRGLFVERRKALSVAYRDAFVECDYRVDFLVESEIVVEVDAAERLDQQRAAQLLGCLRASGCKAGLLINFNAVMFKNGVWRVLNDWLM